MMDNAVRKENRKYVYSNPKYSNSTLTNSDVVSAPRIVKRRKKSSMIAPQNHVQEIMILRGLAVILLAIIFYVGLQVAFCGKEKLANNKIAEVNSQILNEDIKNAALEREYLKKTSFSVVHQKANELGMVEATNRETITPSITYQANLAGE